MSNKTSTGYMIVLSAPSGCGKTSTVERLLKRHSDWTRSVSMTTRAPRPGEKDGEDYIFVSKEKFEELRDNDELLEWAQVFENYYGTPKKQVMDSIAEGKRVILTIDVQGAESVKKIMEDRNLWMSIFILPPSIKVLRERLEGRKTETAEEIDKRLAMAQEEVKAANLYDYTIMNQNLEQTVMDFEEIVKKYEEERRDA